MKRFVLNGRFFIMSHVFSLPFCFTAAKPTRYHHQLKPPRATTTHQNCPNRTQPPNLPLNTAYQRTRRPGLKLNTSNAHSKSTVRTKPSRNRYELRSYSKIKTDGWKPLPTATGIISSQLLVKALRRLGTWVAGKNPLWFIEEILPLFLQSL